MTVIVITATIIGLAFLSSGPTSFSGGQINFEALFSRAMGKQYAPIPISATNNTVN